MEMGPTNCMTGWLLLTYHLYYAHGRYDENAINSR